MGHANHTRHDFTLRRRKSALERMIESRKRFMHNMHNMHAHPEPPDHPIHHTEAYKKMRAEIEAMDKHWLERVNKEIATLEQRLQPGWKLPKKAKRVLPDRTDNTLAKYASMLDDVTPIGHTA